MTSTLPKVEHTEMSGNGQQHVVKSENLYDPSEPMQHHHHQIHVVCSSTSGEEDDGQGCSQHQQQDGGDGAHGGSASTPDHQVRLQQQLEEHGGEWNIYHSLLAGKPSKSG